ncbi:TonB-dependent receptor plug domain-containing protein [Chloroherpeton thalassium]|nr:TonB-dependent receptor [Chloroherpeton thalassium]
MIYQMQPIEVEAEKTDVEINASVPIQELAGEQIKKLSVSNVAEAVKFLPGVTLKDYGGIGGLKTISVRSLGAEHTAVFIDGIKYSDSQTGQVDLGRFSTDKLARIELLSSGLSDETCLPAKAYLMTSSLNLQSKISTLSQLTQPVGFDADVSLGSFGYSAFGLASEMKLSSSLFASVSVEKIDATGEYDYTFQNGELTEHLHRQNTDVHSTRIEMDVVAKFAEASTLSVKGYAFFSERGLPGAVTVDYYDKSKERIYNDDSFLQGTYETKLFERISAKFRGKYGYHFLRYVDPDYYTSGGLDNRYTQHESYASASFAYSVASFLSAFASTDFSLNTIESGRFDDSPERFSWLFVFGLKASFYGVDVNTSLLSSLVEEKSYDDAVTPHRHNLLPAISMGYWITNILHLRASYKQSLRLPNFNEMYYPQYGNVDVRPEYTTQYNVGLGIDQPDVLMLERVSLRVDGFRIITTDKIMAVPRGSLFNWSVTNINRVETTGMELYGEVTTRKIGLAKVNLTASYVYQEALEKTPSTSPYWQEVTANKQIAYTPKQTASVTGGLLFEHYQLNWQMSYVGHRYTSGEQIIQNYLPGYTLHDVNAQVFFKIFEYDAKIKLAVTNIFNTEYVVVKSFPMPGRGVRCSFSIHI